MELTKKDKLLICRAYDSILRKNEALKEILTDEEIEDIKTSSNYTYKRYELHLEMMNRVVQVVRAINPALETNDIINFITNPGFEIALDVANNAFNTKTQSMEDAVLLRNVQSQVVLGNPMKEPTGKKAGLFKKEQTIDVIPIMELIKVDLGKDIFYVTEQEVFVPKTIYELLEKQLDNAVFDKVQCKKARNNFRYEIVCSIYEELIRRNYQLYSSMEPAIYRSEEALQEDFKAQHSVELNSEYWVDELPFIIDNRKHDKDLESDSNVVGTYSLEKQFSK